MTEVFKALGLLSSVKQQDLQIILDLRESTLAQCGRWDQIRWQVPSWFCTLGTLSIGFVTLSEGNNYNPVFAKGFFVAVSLFGVLSLLLLMKLVIYETKVIHEFNENLNRFPVGRKLSDVLTLARPFRFDFPSVLRTATFWFLLYMLILTILFLLLAWKVPLQRGQMMLSGVWPW